MDLKQFGVSTNMENELSYRFIAHLTGQLLAFESMLLLTCCCVSMAYGESDLMAFIISSSVCIAASVMLLVYGRKKENEVLQTSRFRLFSLLRQQSSSYRKQGHR